MGSLFCVKVFYDYKILGVMDKMWDAITGYLTRHLHTP